MTSRTEVPVKLNEYDQAIWDILKLNLDYTDPITARQRIITELKPSDAMLQQYFDQQFGVLNIQATPCGHTWFEPYAICLFLARLTRSADLVVKLAGYLVRCGERDKAEWLAAITHVELPENLR